MHVMTHASLMPSARFARRSQHRSNNSTRHGPAADWARRGGRCRENSCRMEQCCDRSEVRTVFQADSSASINAIGRYSLLID